VPCSASLAAPGRTRSRRAARRTAQPGDPTKAVTAILTTLDSGEPPLRLPPEDDTILGHLDSVHADITTWEKTARDIRLED